MLSLRLSGMHGNQGIEDNMNTCCICGNTFPLEELIEVPIGEVDSESFDRGDVKYICEDCIYMEDS